MVMKNCTFFLKTLALLATTFLLISCSEQEAHHQTAPVIPYMQLSAEPVVLTRELPGRVSPFILSEVRPQVNGVILERLFEEGADVVAGQVLYQIDPVLYEAAYKNAKAELGTALADENAARLRAERYTILVKSNAISKQDYDDAIAAYGRVKARIESAREALESARINLGYTKVTSPVSGRVGLSFVTPGTLVTQSQAEPLAAVQQISPVYVNVLQPTTEILQIRRKLASGALKNDHGSAAKVRLYLEDGEPYARLSSEAKGKMDWLDGELLFSDITVVPSTSVITVRIKFDNPDGTLLPGMYVRAVIEEGVVENALLVPQKSVSRDMANRPQVFILTKQPPSHGGASPRPLEEKEFYVEPRTIIIGRDYANRWLVAGGLSSGELLVTDGHLHVRPGMVVVGEEQAPPATLISSQRYSLEQR